MRSLYTFSIVLYGIGIRVASLFNEKAKKWIAGRKDWVSNLQHQLIKRNQNKLIWFHCASLGEFEQGRPVLEEIKEKFPHHQILLTFFSPSGYEVRKDYPVADFIAYLPSDVYSDAKTFIELVKPDIAVFVKYEFWFNYLYHLQQNNIPVIYISVIFRKSQFYFKNYSSWFREQLKSITHLFVQDESSKNLLQDIGIIQVTVAGDTRFDRVLKVSEEDISLPIIEEFKNDQPVLVAGSTWPKDEELVLNAFLTLKKEASFKNLKLIIAPHEVNEKRISELNERIKNTKSQYYSSPTNELAASDILIIDSIGLLSRIYSYGNYAYIGGGFNNGIHNILEAATFGLPIFFGPKHKRFKEAVELVNLKCAFSVEKSIELSSSLKSLNNQEISAKLKEYVRSNSNATTLILKKIEPYLN